MRLLLSDRVGYQLPSDFKSFMHRQASTLVRDMGFDSLLELANELDRSADGTPIWVRFISRMTIGESYLFRNPNHMDLLRRVLLPDLLERARDRPVSIWSAGCARGEEPYTLAILLHELHPAVRDLPIRIIATDIDADALDDARKAKYGAWAFRQTPYHIQRKYFTKRGRWLVLHPTVTSLVSFGYHHIALDQALSIFPPQGFDIVLCRNVLMYLRPDYRERAGRVLSRRLHDEGVVLPGQVERVDGADDELESVFVEGSAVYYPRFSIHSRHLLARDADVSHGRMRRVPVSEPRLIAATLPKEDLAALPPDEMPAAPNPYELRPRVSPEDEVSRRLEALTASELYDTVRALMSAGDVAGAQEHCIQLIEQDPLDAAHHCLLALVLLESQNTVGAIDALRRAVYCDPDNLSAYYIWWLIGVQHHGSRWDRTQWARRHLIRLIKELPDDHVIPLVGRVTAADIRYLLQRDWTSF